VYGVFLTFALGRAAANAACVNTVGSFTCQCYLTFIGDGRTSGTGCTADVVAQDDVEASFFTNQKGDASWCSVPLPMSPCKTRICLPAAVNGFPTSQNVVYPTTAPGWVRDPTGMHALGQANASNLSLAQTLLLHAGFYAEFGSRVNVTLLECKIACDTAGTAGGRAEGDPTANISAARL
jgi:hypothetical protein